MSFESLSGAGQRRLESARTIAETGGEMALRSFRTGEEVTTKRDKMDLVTQADSRVQENIIEAIERAYPDDSIVGEESGFDGEIPTDGWCWVIDPIDGTVNYARNNRLWATAIALIRDGRPVAGIIECPAIGDTVVGTNEQAIRNGEPISVSTRTDPETFTISPTFGLARQYRASYKTVAGEIIDRCGDIRRYGSGQLSLTAVAAGEIDAAVSSIRLSPWDTIAGATVIRGAGGVVTNKHGDRWQADDNTIVAASPGAQDVGKIIAAAGNDQLDYP